MQDFLDKIFHSEQEDLLSRLQSEFWESLFNNALMERNYQNDFFLTNRELSCAEIVEKIKDTFIKLSQKYDFSFIKQKHCLTTVFKTRFFDYEYKEIFTEFAIVVCPKDIAVIILPFNQILQIFLFKEYFLLESILMDVCEALYKKQQLRINKLLEECKKIKTSSENLTFKTIEIAQNSIKTLYNASEQQFRSLYQKYLYSDLLINKEKVRIFHKDFLEDPGILINRLKANRIDITI